MANSNPGPEIKKDIINHINRRQRVQSLLPPYPNGWFCVMESKNLKAGKTQRLDLLGMLELLPLHGQDDENLTEKPAGFRPEFGRMEKRGRKGIHFGRLLPTSWCPFGSWGHSLW